MPSLKTAWPRVANFIYKGLSIITLARIRKPESLYCKMRTRRCRTEPQGAPPSGCGISSPADRIKMQPLVKSPPTPKQTAMKTKATPPAFLPLSSPDKSLAGSFTPPSMARRAKRRLEPPNSDPGIQEVATPSNVERARKTNSVGAAKTAMVAVTGPASAAAPVVKPVVGGQILPAIRAWTVESLEEAVRHLAAKDARLAPLIEEHGVPDRLLPKGFDNMFASLAKSIVYQQLAGNAAHAIHTRFLAACGCTDAIQPASVLNASFPTLRACGLSERKASYLIDLAKHFENGSLSNARIAEFTDEDLVTELTKVKGIGRWTVDMFAMFHLGRPNILPVGDLAVRKGLISLYKLKDTASLKELEAVGAKWTPYRSLGSYYMWKVPTERSAKKSKTTK